MIYGGFVAIADQIAVHIQTRLENLVIDVAPVISQRITVTHLEKVARNATPSYQSNQHQQREIYGEGNVCLCRCLFIDDHIFHTLLHITITRRKTTLCMYNLSSPQKRTAMMLTVITETTRHAPPKFLLNAPASVLTLNESSVDGFRSNFFSILRMELIVTKTSAERVLLLENKNRTKSVRILEYGKQTEANAKKREQRINRNTPRLSHSSLQNAVGSLLDSCFQAEWVNSLSENGQCVRTAVATLPQGDFALSLREGEKPVWERTPRVKDGDGSPASTDHMRTGIATRWFCCSRVCSACFRKCSPESKC